MPGRGRPRRRKGCEDDECGEEGSPTAAPSPASEPRFAKGTGRERRLHPVEQWYTEVNHIDALSIRMLLRGYRGQMEALVRGRRLLTYHQLRAAPPLREHDPGMDWVREYTRIASKYVQRRVALRTMVERGEPLLAVEGTLNWRCLEDAECGLDSDELGDEELTFSDRFARLVRTRQALISPAEACDLGTRLKPRTLQVRCAGCAKRVFTEEPMKLRCPLCYDVFYCTGACRRAHVDAHMGRCAMTVRKAQQLAADLGRLPSFPFTRMLHERRSGVERTTVVPLRVAIENPDVPSLFCTHISVQQAKMALECQPLVLATLGDEVEATDAADRDETRANADEDEARWRSAARQKGHRVAKHKPGAVDWNEAYEYVRETRKRM